MYTAVLAIAGTIVGGGLYPSIGKTISTLGHFAPFAILVAGAISVLEATSLGALMSRHPKSVCLGELMVNSTRSQPFAGAQALAALVQFSFAAIYVALTFGDVAVSLTNEFLGEVQPPWYLQAFWACFAIMSVWYLSRFPQLSQQLRALMALLELFTVFLFIIALTICNFIAKGPSVTALDVQQVEASPDFISIIAGIVKMAFAFGGIAASVNELATQRDTLSGMAYVKCAAYGVALVMAVYSTASYFMLQVLQPHDLTSIKEHYITAVPDIIAMALSILWDKAWGKHAAVALSHKYALATIITKILMMSSMHNTVGGTFETVVRELSGAAKRKWIPAYFEGAEESTHKSRRIATVFCGFVLYFSAPFAIINPGDVLDLTSLCIFITSAFTHVAALSLQGVPVWVHWCSMAGVICSLLLFLGALPTFSTIAPIAVAVALFGAGAAWIFLLEPNSLTKVD